MHHNYEKADYVWINASVSEKLSSLSSSRSECCIFRVHNQLRNVNEKAYEPNMIAIGPYHHGKPNLHTMEEHKLRYLQLLLERRNENVQRYIDEIGKVEEEARSYYSDRLSLNPNKMIEMMLLDGCFIVELVRKFKYVYLRERNDPIFEVNWIVSGLQRDLLLFENQLPLFLLCKLFDMIEVPNNHKRFIYLALEFFKGLLPHSGHKAVVEGDNLQHKFKHLLGLVHNNWLPSFAHVAEVELEKRKKRIPCATGLREAGIDFEKLETSDLFDIKFDNGIMKIPCLTVEDRTESFIRNLVAYELYGRHTNLSYVIDYVKFMDCLIDTPKDVGILCRRGIIDNLLGDDEAVSNMFNKICDSVVDPRKRFHYAQVFENVNIHCNKHKNRWMAKLRRDYLNSPWAIISVLAAFVLLVFTLLQTVYTMKG